MKHLTTLFFIAFCYTPFLQAQEANTKNNELKSGFVKGTVVNAKNDSIIDNVNIVNLTQIKGTISDLQGNFQINAQVNDSLFFSYLGFETITIKVTQDWLKYGQVTIAMTEKGIALEEVVVDQMTLTGFLEIDAKRAPIYNTRKYSISGLPVAYEAGDDEPGAVTKVLGSIFNPADFLYNTFGKKGSSMRKLRKIKEQDEIRVLLQSKYDRETLMTLLGLDKIEIDRILRNCQYSKEFITNSNDLQILDAISECYEEYKVLKRDRK